MANKKTFEVALILTAADKASRIINDVTVNAKKRIDGMSNMGDKAFGVGRSAGAAGLVGASIIGGFVKAAADMESLNIGLQSSFRGNKEAAAAAFQEINKFAAQTPFELAEVTTSFLKLKNMGLDPSVKALEAYGNIASSMPGKTLNDFVEAVADAVTGENERLKEFGIKAKKDGDIINYTFQGVTTSVRNNSKSIEQYLKYIGTVKFAGATVAQSKSINGQLSTLKDNVVMTAAKIGSTLIPKLTELFKKITPIIDRVAVWVDKNPRLTKTILMIVAAAAALSFTVSATAFVFGGLFKAIAGVMWISNTYRTLMLTMKAAQMAYTFSLLSTGSGFAAVSAGLKAMNLGFLASPIFWGIALIAGAAYLIYANWDKIKVFFGKLWDGIKVIFNKAWEFFKNWGVLFLGPVGLIIKYWDKIPTFFSSLWPKVKGIFMTFVNWMLFLPRMFLNIGINIITSIWDGMKSKAAALFNFVKEIGNKIAGAFKSVLGIASPSKVFMDFGTNITEGATKGIQKGSPSAVSASRGMGKSMAPNATGARGGGGIGGITVTFAPVIQSSGGDSQNILAELKKYTPQLIREIQSALERKQRLSF